MVLMSVTRQKKWVTVAKGSAQGYGRLISTVAKGEKGGCRVDSEAERKDG